MKPLEILVVCAGASLASGCAEVSRQAGEMSQRIAAVMPTSPGAASAAAGDSPQPLERRDAPAAAPSARDRGAQAPLARSAGSGTSSRPGTLAVGRKRLPLASQELDTNCSQVVAPFDLDVNLATLGRISAEGAQKKLADLVRGRQAGGHLLSKPLREEAMRMNWLPMSVEKRYGAYTHRRSVEQRSLLSRDEPLGRQLYPVADKMLAELLEGVGQTDYAFELHIRKAGDDNAIALPGGFLHIDASLLRSEKKWPEARFALSHEIAHVLQRHETRLVQARVIDTVSLTGSVTDLLNTLKDPGQMSEALLKSAATGKGAFNRHFESQELQADACAVRILDGAYEELTEVDASLNAFMASLARQAPGGDSAAGRSAPKAQPSSVADLLEDASKPMDRHPSSSERMANLSAMRKAIAVQRVSASR